MHRKGQQVKHVCLCCMLLPVVLWCRRDGRGLAQLLRELAELPGLRWMRILYAYPSYFDDELVAEIARNSKVGRHSARSQAGKAGAQEAHLRPCVSGMLGVCVMAACLCAHMYKACSI